MKPAQIVTQTTYDRDTVLDQAKRLIAELRNRRDPKKNWTEFRNLIELHHELIVRTFSSRWLISICDTYADYAGDAQRRNALLISLFFNMIRVSDSLYEDCDVREERIQQIREGWPPFYDELHAINIDKQDTCLNLAKRLIRQLKDDCILYDVFTELLRRAKNNDNLITRLARRSKKPEWFFPENALDIVDNYGVLWDSLPAEPVSELEDEVFGSLGDKLE